MIDSQAFNQQLSNSDTPLDKVYVFYGQTPFLSEENAHNLVQTAKQKGITLREIFYIDNRSKLQNILDSLQSPGLFDPKKIIELRFDTEKPTKKIGEQIAKVAAHQSDNILIIQASHLDRKVQKEKWFAQTLSYSTVVVSKPIYANQLPNWIHQRAEQLAIKLDGEALKTIMQFSEGNLLWTNQILMQLAHSDYPQPIKKRVIEDMLADMSVFRIDDLTTALLNKNPHALKIVEKLEHENESLVFITTVLYRDIDTLLQIATSGQPFEQACRQLRVWQSKKAQYQTALRHYSEQQLLVTLKSLAQLDRINKGQEKGDGWLLLSKIIDQLIHPH
ncbi:MAG: DNA polymerase III subunit delta [Gammaproteobacteria bacterium]|nr:MAG: DNA polymerase III subunit delta [Gammaproteobacteria bacterium]